MFTMKVQYEKGDNASWRTYQGRQYSVRYHGRAEAQIVVQHAKDEEPARTEIKIEDGQTAYVMNESGQTIDTIRTDRKT